MRSAINQWTFPPGRPIRRCIEEAASAGFEGIELALTESEGDELSVFSSPATLREIARFSADHGVVITSVACLALMYHPLSSPDPPVWQAGIDLVRRMLDAASHLGARGVLVVPGYVQLEWEAAGEVIPYDVAYDRALSALRTLAPHAAGCQVWLGVENVWNKFLLSPLEMRDFIDGVDSPWVGAYFDAGNVLRYGYPEQWIRILGHRVRQVHVKDFRTRVGTLEGFVVPFEGDVDWPAVVRSLQAVHYDGFLVAELMPPYRHAPELLVRQAAQALSVLVSGGFAPGAEGPTLTGQILGKGRKHDGD